MREAPRHIPEYAHIFADEDRLPLPAMSVEVSGDLK